MTILQRQIAKEIKTDIKKKMIIVGGARQVGKTTMAVGLLSPKTTKNPAYMNWDVLEHRSQIMKGHLPLKYKLIVLDEIHKFSDWRNLIKGIYDQHKDTNSFLITGSARLDYYSKGGDSLLGRYHYYRLHPFTLLEMSKNPNTSDLEQLFNFGGFPEPLFAANKKEQKRWQRERKKLVIYEDLRDLHLVKEISLIDLLAESLPERVGSPLSIRSLKEDLQVSHQSVERWISYLETLYMVYRIAPFGSPKIRAVKKEQKLFFWDWAQVQGRGARFENMVASHLLKYCHYIEDTEGDDMELRFLRDTDKREVDLVVLKNKKPLFAVECKTGEKKISPHIKYFSERTAIPKFYQVHMGKKDFGNEKTIGRVLPFTTFCKEVLGV